MEYNGFTIVQHYGQWKVIVNCFTEVLCDTKEEAIDYCDKMRTRMI